MPTHKCRDSCATELCLDTASEMDSDQYAHIKLLPVESSFDLHQLLLA